ncbi:hypothetical protein Aperf_G00000046585 [Anoplocephala perfoliata]
MADLEGDEDEVYDNDDDESDYDVPLPEPLTPEVVRHMTASLPLRAVDMYRLRGTKALTDVDRDRHGDENLTEKRTTVSQESNGIESKMELMTSLDDIRKSRYRKNFLIRSGITAQHREYTIRWLTQCHNYFHLSTEVFHKTIDLLDSYLFLNVIVPMDYKAVAIACMSLAYEFKSNGNPEDIYTRLPSIGGFYTTGQVKIVFQYVLELTMPDLEFCKITSCAKAALVLYLIRYILRKKCDCDSPNFLCEHRFMQVWTPKLAWVTKCPETEYFLTGVHKYAEILVNLGGACAIYYQHHGSPVPFSAAFNKYVDSVAADPKLTQLEMEDFAF